MVYLRLPACVLYILQCVCVCVSISVCLLVSHPAALSYISRGASLLSRLQRWWIDTGWARLSSCPHKAHRCLVRVTPASPCPAVTLSALEIRMCLRSTHSRHPVNTPTHINTHEYTTAHAHISVLMGLSLFFFFLKRCLDTLFFFQAAVTSFNMFQDFIFLNSWRQ